MRGFHADAVRAVARTLAPSHRALPALWLQQRLEKTGLFDGVMSRHRRHHRQNDGTNYNITWPVGDWLFGTLAAK